jgi:hypothetical protein
MLTFSSRHQCWIDSTRLDLTRRDSRVRRPLRHQREKRQQQQTHLPRLSGKTTRSWEGGKPMIMAILFRGCSVPEAPRCWHPKKEQLVRNRKIPQPGPKRPGQLTGRTQHSPSWPHPSQKHRQQRPSSSPGSWRPHPASRACSPANELGPANCPRPESLHLVRQDGPILDPEGQSSSSSLVIRRVAVVGTRGIATDSRLSKLEARSWKLEAGSWKLVTDRDALNARNLFHSSPPSDRHARPISTGMLAGQ